MGSHHNSTNSLNKSSHNKLKKNLSENYQNNQSNIYYNDSLSYKGVKTETTSININSQSGNSSTSDKVENISNDIKIPTLFQWKEGGNNIIITGSFCGWSHNFAMRKNEKNNIYELTLYLPKGEYQFKFIVDNIWRCSNFYPTVTDQNNNTNNVLNNTKELNDIIKEREKENQNTANTTPDFDKNSTNLKKKSNHQNASVNLSEQMKKNYTNLFPLKEQLNSEPPHLPQHYLNPLSYNSYPNIGEKEFIYNRFKNNLIRQTFQSVKIPTHVYLNHILRNCKEEKKYIRSSISFRIRSKFATIIYLHPNKQELIYQNKY
jgi:hypothetical protein